MENKEGLIIVLDFAKAFDTIDWSYIYSCMKMFGYGDRFITMIKLLHSGSTSVIENNGHFSRNIQLSRGCRQGDPISPYIFVLCAELLSPCVRECGDIKGIEVHGTEIIISQYADDTTLFLEGSHEDIKRLMSILRWFRNVSGLGINVDKTKAVKIGATRDRSLNWEGKYGMEWTNKFTVLGIDYNVDEMGWNHYFKCRQKNHRYQKIDKIMASSQIKPLWQSYGHKIFIPIKNHPPAPVPTKSQKNSLHRNKHLIQKFPLEQQTC